LFTGFFENGNKSMEVSFKDDKISGIFRKWAEDGKLVTESNFSKDSLTFTGQRLGIGKNSKEKK
jgi:antitoxin component YwqK of YwqJK toxin-antitoxin module